MDDHVEFRDVGSRFRRHWWVPALLAVAGVVLAVVVSNRVAPIYRAQGTLLVGPLSQTVTLSSTVNASESYAGFYADLARRETVLRPVVNQLHLKITWGQLSDEVSAVVPDQNPRVVTVEVDDPAQARANRITRAILQRLRALAPHSSGIGNEQSFLRQQATSLQSSIDDAQATVDRLQKAATKEPDAQRRAVLNQRRSDQQKRLGDFRHTYAELMSIAPEANAGGLHSLDGVMPVNSLDRAGIVRQGLLGGVVGGVLGMLIVWLLTWPRRRRPALAVLEEDLDRHPSPPLVSPAARQRPAMTSAARARGRGR
ncbi:MAG: hypothetical protein ACRDPH_10825 [Marmoricola sp.]